MFRLTHLHEYPSMVPMTKTSSSTVVLHRDASAAPVVYYDIDLDGVIVGFVVKDMNGGGWKSYVCLGDVPPTVSKNAQLGIHRTRREAVDEVLIEWPSWRKS